MSQRAVRPTREASTPWTNEQVIAIRRLARKGVRAGEIKACLNLPETEQTMQKRAQRFGFTLATGLGPAGARRGVRSKAREASLPNEKTGPHSP